MSRTILVEEFHIGLRAPKDLAEAEYRSIRRALDAARFQAEIRRAVREAMDRHPVLGKVRVVLSR